MRKLRAGIGLVRENITLRILFPSPYWNYDEKEIEDYSLQNNLEVKYDNEGISSTEYNFLFSENRKHLENAISFYVCGYSEIQYDKDSLNLQMRYRMEYIESKVSSLVDSIQIQS